MHFKTNYFLFHEAYKTQRNYVNKFVRDTKANYCEMHIDKNKRNERNAEKHRVDARRQHTARSVNLEQQIMDSLR